MPNGSGKPQDELEGIPPKLYKLAVGVSSSLLAAFLVVFGGIVWRLNADCPAVQRDVRAALELGRDNHAAIEQLQWSPKGHSEEQWYELVGRVIRLEEYRASDERKMNRLDEIKRTQ